MIIESNKKAYFDYFIEETFEAGIVLSGAEVKSVRAGNVSLKESFCHIENAEIILKNCHIAPYKFTASVDDSLDPRRNRKLLLHKREINKLVGKVKEKGYTLVATKLYKRGNRIKIEIALAKGKHMFDKKNVLKEKDLLRQAQRDIQKARG